MEVNRKNGLEPGKPAVPETSRCAGVKSSDAEVHEEYPTDCVLEEASETESDSKEEPEDKP